MATIQYKMKTRLGPLYIVAFEKGLQGVYWGKELDKSVSSLNPSRPEDKIILKAVKQLEEYFAGKRKEFDLPLHFTGTPFQNRVWRAQNPKAVRAVGSAVGDNPYCIIVPCHRVIASDGSIGGYAGGVPIKRRLLEIEKV